MKGNQIFMKKKPKYFHLSAPSQLNQIIDYVFVQKAKNIDSSCKTHDTTERLYLGDTKLVCKTYDVSA